MMEIETYCDLRMLGANPKLAKLEAPELTQLVLFWAHG